MKTLIESILADMNDVLDKGNKNMHKVLSVGNKIELNEIIGDETCLISISKSKILDEIKSFDIDSKFNDIINSFADRYCFGTLSNNIKTVFKALLTYIDNIQLENTNIDFDNKKIKDSFCKDLTTNLKNKNIIPANAEFNNNLTQTDGGDKTGIFLLTFQYKQYAIHFLYKIKK